MKKITIAIDGYSSTGKSSISKIIAQRLGLVHLDTGALYRGITVFALKHHLREKTRTLDVKQLIKHLGEIHLEFRNVNNALELFLNNENINQEIRSVEVSENVSIVAKQPEVRDFLLETQRSFAEKGGIVVDGRDIGTVVLPNADYKFFLTASIEERANRRFQELSSQGIFTDIESVKLNLIQRDKIDSEREIAPLKKAPDAILIDNTHIDKDQTLDLILSYIKQ